MGYKVAVVGATGNVGREILSTLSERGFPADEVVALASRASVGKEISFGEDVILTVRALDDFDFICEMIEPKFLDAAEELIAVLTERLTRLPPRDGYL